VREALFTLENRLVVRNVETVAVDAKKI